MVAAEAAAAQAEQGRVDAEGSARVAAAQEALERVRAHNATTAAECDRLEAQLRQLRRGPAGGV